MANAVEAVFQLVVGIDGEVGGDHRQPRTVANFSSEEIRDAAAPVIVTYARVARECWHVVRAL